MLPHYHRKLTMAYFDAGMLSAGNEMAEAEGISAFRHKAT
ncbi:hypothetical protein CSC12_6173 (plasmid) [Klebsiella michiganensis]|jgi:hypothetical protein|nr:hypothetical protein CSC12_6173 [Klebsiella michiganensis]